MAQAALARLMLRKARLFHARATDALANNAEGLEPLFEAAVVFGRNVTFYLQKEFTGRDGFSEWYPTAQERMRADKLLRFFNETRRMILHIRPLGLQRIIEMTARDAIQVTDYGIVMVPEPSRASWPWTARLEEALRRLCVRLRRWRARLRRQPSSGPRVAVTRVDVIPTVYFPDAEWRQRSALDLLKEYLDRLEEIVIEAELNVK